MSKILIVLLALIPQGCISFSRRPPPAPTPPATVLIEEVDEEQFAQMDKNKDGKLDKEEIRSATTKTDEMGAIKIFLILIAAVALICVAPLTPALVKKVINKRKKSDPEEK